jgi:hypothetical protein
MSGGSFNYLCHRSASDVFDGDDLLAMATALETLGRVARDAAERTRKLHELQDHIAREIEALQDVWRAVEWWHSCDYGRDDVLVALGEYKAKQP